VLSGSADELSLPLDSSVARCEVLSRLITEQSPNSLFLADYQSQCEFRTWCKRKRKSGIAQHVPFLCSFWNVFLPATAQKWDTLGYFTFSLHLSRSPKFGLRLKISQKVLCVFVGGEGVSTRRGETVPWEAFTVEGHEANPAQTLHQPAQVGWNGQSKLPPVPPRRLLRFTWKHQPPYLVLLHS